MHLKILFALSTFLMLSSPVATRADVWTEVGDAGELRLTAQRTKGPASLSAILGSFGTAGDRDLFWIYIADPDAFSASTNNAETADGGLLDGDTQLFLFDLLGNGVIGNDDDPDDPAALSAAIPIGAFSGLAGRYLLGISTFDVDPVSLEGEIFVDESADGLLEPNGPGGSSPLVGWVGEPDPEQAGDYRIDLTGATFAVVPEPNSVALLALGAGVIALGRRRRIG